MGKSMENDHQQNMEQWLAWLAKQELPAELADVGLQVHGLLSLLSSSHSAGSTTRSMQTGTAFGPIFSKARKAGLLVTAVAGFVNPELESIKTRRLSLSANWSSHCVTVLPSQVGSLANHPRCDPINRKATMAAAKPQQIFRGRLIL